MSNKIYKISISLNVQKEFKLSFLKEIINTIKEFRVKNPEVELFIFRNIENGPKINVYIYGKRDVSYTLYCEVESLFQKFLKENKLKFRENSIYSTSMEELKTMNNLLTYSNYENLTLSFECIDNIERNGEYHSDEEKEFVNKWLLENGTLIEDTINFVIEEEPYKKILFAVLLFKIISSKLDRKSLRGYLSFKSHYEGFINYKEYEMKGYAEKFKKYYDVYHQQLYSNFYTFDKMKDEHMRRLLMTWANRIDKAVVDIKVLPRRKLEVDHMESFVEMSEFHKNIFSQENIHYYVSDEFQNYRILINLIYLLLPTLGINTIERLLGSYILIRLIEEG
ncbi:hypothetical protein [Bacillus sp. FSL R9-9410]|uniref:hypothetical protein n=1 Tax=Bacillus sp. FSL R9-9410 TaxID=2921590 RepID=UPI003100BFBC